MDDDREDDEDYYEECITSYNVVCRICGQLTVDYDENGPLCIDCAVVKALKEGQ